MGLWGYRQFAVFANDGPGHCYGTYVEPHLHLLAVRSTTVSAAASKHVRDAARALGGELRIK